MCLLQHCICVSRPCEILGDVNAEELKAVYLNYSPQTAFSHRCSYFPGLKEQCAGWRQKHRLWNSCCDMKKIVADIVKQAAQSRCSLWWVFQNTCWRWVLEQRASSHSSMWFYFSSVWAEKCQMPNANGPKNVDFLKHEADRERERLKMSVKTPASWNAHALSTRPGMPFGPTALRMFIRLKDWVTSATEMKSGLTSSAVAVGAFSVWAVLSASKRA